MASYLPPTETLPKFNPSVFQSNLTADELDTKVKSLENKTTFISRDGLTTEITGVAEVNGNLTVSSNLAVGSNTDVEQSIDDLEDKTTFISRSALTTEIANHTEITTLDVTGNTDLAGTLEVGMETTLNRTATVKKIVHRGVTNDAAIDNMLTTVYNELNGYENYENCITMENDGGNAYRTYTMGMLGDNASNSNVFAIGGFGGGTPLNENDPNIVFGINQNGNTEIAGDVTLDKNLTVVGSTVEIGANGHYPMLQSSSVNLFTNSGVNTDGTQFGTQTFSPAFTTTPFVVAQMISGSGSDAFIINVHNVTTTGFDYKKFYGTVGTNTINTATTEDFYWIAIGRIAN